jgi:hypothetical protein
MKLGKKKYSTINAQRSILKLERLSAISYPLFSKQKIPALLQGLFVELFA